MNRSKYGITVSTRVCWSMISLTQIAQGSRVFLHGRSRFQRAYQDRSSFRSFAACATPVGGASFDPVSTSRRDPGIAAILSLLIPGVGQIYNGAFLRGIFWLIITPGFWIGTGGLFGWVCHVIAAWTAHRRAN